MRAAVVGTGWGQVHVVALQELGVEVVALCGTDLERTQEVARQHGVGLALQGVGELPNLELDMACIAAPTAAHAALVAQLGPLPLLCEKPAVGVETPIRETPRTPGPVWVNYAFGFLDVATQADAVLDGQLPGIDIGSVERVDVTSTYDLAEVVREVRSPWQWFSDVASHPWSWAFARMGAPQPHGVSGLNPMDAHANAGEAQLSYLAATSATVTVTARQQAGLQGLSHHVRVRGERGEMTFGGQFRLGQQWTFGPLQLDGTAVGGGGGLTQHPRGLESNSGSGSQPWPAPDAWHRANVAAIAEVVALVRAGHVGNGDESVQGSRGRTFTWERALAMDACVQAAAA